MRKLSLILIGLLMGAGVHAQELEKFSKGGKYGFRDKNGKVVIPAKYYDVGDFSEGLAAVEVAGEKFTIGQRWGYIDKTGSMVIPPQYCNAKKFSEGLAAVQKEKGYGYIDKAGDIVIPMRYTNGFDFTNGLARVLHPNKRWVYIDKTGAVELCKDPIKSYIQQANEYY